MPASSLRRVRPEVGNSTSLPTSRQHLIFYESPHRLSATLKDMLDLPHAIGSAVVARELTKRYEEFKHGTLSELESWASAHAAAR